MKKILIVMGNWYLGGGEKVTKIICENLNKDKYQIDLLIARKIQKEDVLKPSFPYPTGVRIYNIKRHSFFKLFFSLMDFFCKKKYHIILTAIDQGTASLVVLLNNFLFKKTKIIISFHSFFEFKIKKHRHFFTKPTEKYFLKKADFYITVSKDLEKYVKKTLNIPQDKIKTVYNPVISEDIFKKMQVLPKEFEKYQEYKKVLFVGRLDNTSKDFDTLVKAFKLVKNKINKIKLFIVGGGPDRDKIIDIINKLSLKDDVILLGVKNNPYSYMHYSDVFVLASHFEGLGSVIVEAMACECPVVATDCPTGTRELLGNNENGLLVPMENAEEMAEAITKLLENESLRQKLIINGKEKPKEFSVKKSIKEYESVFGKILNE